MKEHPPPSLVSRQGPFLGQGDISQQRFAPSLSRDRGGASVAVLEASAQAEPAFCHLGLVWRLLFLAVEFLCGFSWDKATSSPWE